MLPSNKYPTGSSTASVVAARCLIAGLIPLVLAGCEAPLNLSGVEQEQSKSLRRTDQLQALVANDQVQVAVGNNGLVLTRPLGEQAWQRQILPGEPGLIDLDACADNTLIALSFEKQLWRSDDNGTSWQAFDLNTPENMLDLTCAPDGTYWAVGSFSTFLSSTDQGESWNEVSLNEDAMLTSIQFLNEQLGYAAGEFGTLTRTTDGGDNWEVLAPMRDEFYPQTTLFTDADTGWSVGLDGTVLHTTDGGDSWSLSPTPVAAPLYGLFETRGDLYALGENATVLKRSGDQWTPVPVKARPVYLRAGLATEQGALVAGGNGTLLSLAL
ncbi:WD40/YVTN/BNR-like repeat-containing protein [Marinobacterium litorale]|uniref:WD40/YVTN/BNR-like repeat-containing protein n=1 Tax=Marinobacterium litorale TaxID=404770 RepID=UPI000403538C|nr:YCF48-related protein [Marinobacterium litorale]